MKTLRDFLSDNGKMQTPLEEKKTSKNRLINGKETAEEFCVRMMKEHKNLYERLSKT